MSIVRFKEDTHQYFSGDTELMSVSAFVHQFEPVKDWKSIARKKSNKLKKEGIIKSPQELLDEWDRKRLLGSSAGTTVHKIKEEIHLQRSETPVEPARYQGGFKVSIPLLDLKNNTSYPELMISNLEHGICGQSDRVDIQNNQIFIRDYKTDKSIDFHAYSDYWTKPEKLLDPLSHLDNCNGNVYSLKMSMYMYMVWKATNGRFKPGKIELIWCPIERDDDGIPILYDGVPKILREEIIEIPYRKKEIMDMLKYKK